MGRALSHCFVEKNIVPKSAITSIKQELCSIANILDPKIDFDGLDDCWNYFKGNDRGKGRKIYNAFKRMISVNQLAVDEGILCTLRNKCSMKLPALVDVNCRIDSYGEDHYLFDWHQDYWFSGCSPHAMVVWIPVSSVPTECGGLEIIDTKSTAGKIFEYSAGTGLYNSYADAFQLNQDIKGLETDKLTNLSSGDAAFFSFAVLHRSLPVLSPIRSRFTIQLRFADFADSLFVDNEYKPNPVHAN